MQVYKCNLMEMEVVNVIDFACFLFTEVRTREGLFRFFDRVLIVVLDGRFIGPSELN